MKRSPSFALVICGVALLAFGLMLQPEPAPEPPPPEPTSPTVLAILDVWGARYKLNKDNQVHWLTLKGIPLADDELSVLEALPDLKYLYMRGMQTAEGGTWTDRGLEHLAGLRKLKTLDLSANHRLTDEGLRHLAGLKHLIKLDLSGNYQLTDECSRWLGQLTSLRKLDLTSTNLTEASLPELAKLKNLEWLQLRLRKTMELTKETVPYFREIPLKELKGIRIQEQDRYLVSQLRHLEHYPTDPVDPRQQLRDIDLVHFRHIPQIKHLSVSLSNGWSDTSRLRYLKDFSQLKQLEFAASDEPGEEFDAEGIESLADMPSLRRVRPSRIDDRVLEALSHCPQITILDLTSPANRISAEGLRSLQQMPKLKALTLHRNDVNDETIEAISGIKSLEMLALDGRTIYFSDVSGSSYWHTGPRDFSIESLQELTRLPHLKALYLDYWGLGDEALEYLSHLQNLESLSIGDKADRGSGIPISEPALLKLRHLTKLKSLNFYGTTTSIQAAERLHEFLPDCYMTDNWCCGCMSIGPLESLYVLRDSFQLDE